MQEREKKVVSTRTHNGGMEWVCSGKKMKETGSVARCNGCAMGVSEYWTMDNAITGWAQPLSIRDLHSSHGVLSRTWCRADQADRN